MSSKLDALLNISLPKETIEKFFPHLDPNIPLPIQLPESMDADSFDTKTLSTEIILAGLLIIFAYDRANPYIEYYRKIFNLLRPGIRTEMTDAAIIKTRNGDYENAEEILLALEGLNPEDGTTKLNLALLMEDKAEFYEKADLFDEASLYFDRAEKLYNLLISFEPAIPAVFFNAGYFFARKKDYARVRSLLSTYIKIETSTSKTAKIRLEKAENFINLISSQSLDDDLISVSYKLINEGREEEASHKIKEFLHKNPKVWNAWFLLGWALRRQNRWEDAKSSFLQSLGLLNTGKENDASVFSNLYNELAICEMELGFFIQSEKYLLEALEYEPENIKIISNLGTLALKQDKKEEAYGFFRAVLVINPNDTFSKRMLGL